LGPAHPEHKMTVVLGLKQRNLAALEKMFNDVSNPTHESYGQHMSKEQVSIQLTATAPSCNVTCGAIVV
jgi:hypothetical protein